MVDIYVRFRADLAAVLRKGYPEAEPADCERVAYGLMCLLESNELMRELIATRFHLAAYVARDQSNGATAAASAAPWYPLQTSPGALLSPLACGADGLMKAVRALDVGATTAILSPGCVLAPSADTADTADTIGTIDAAEAGTRYATDQQGTLNAGRRGATLLLLLGR